MSKCKESKALLKTQAGYRFPLSVNSLKCINSFKSSVDYRDIGFHWLCIFHTNEWPLPVLWQGPVIGPEVPYDSIHLLNGISCSVACGGAGVDATSSN